MANLDPTRYAPIHRIITIDASAGRVAARIADNVHQFDVNIQHRGGYVTSILGEAARVPWTTCPAALARLQDLIGAKLAASLPPTIDKTHQCTHLFDIARLAMSQALRLGKRRYDVHVIIGREPDAIDTRVLLDGTAVVEWMVVDDRVANTGPFQGHLTLGSANWPDGVDDPDIRAAVLMLRRALLVFLGSGRSWGTLQASELPYMAGACHSFQPGPMLRGRRPDGFRHYPADAVEELSSN